MEYLLEVLIGVKLSLSSLLQNFFHQLKHTDGTLIGGKLSLSLERFITSFNYCNTEGTWIGDILVSSERFALTETLTLI